MDKFWKFGLFIWLVLVIIGAFIWAPVDPVLKEFTRIFPDSFNTLPFISSQKLAVVKNAEKLSSKGRDLILKMLNIHC